MWNKYSLTKNMKICIEFHTDVPMKLHPFSHIWINHIYVYICIYIYVYIYIYMKYKINIKYLSAIYVDSINPWITEQKNFLLLQNGVHFVPIFLKLLSHFFHDLINRLNWGQNGALIHIFQFSCSYIEWKR
jgi:hypothetical protein